MTSTTAAKPSMSYNTYLLQLPRSTANRFRNDFAGNIAGLRAAVLVHATKKGQPLDDSLDPRPFPVPMVDKRTRAGREERNVKPRLDEPASASASASILDAASSATTSSDVPPPSCMPVIEEPETEPADHSGASNLEQQMLRDLQAIDGQGNTRFRLRLTKEMPPRMSAYDIMMHFETTTPDHAARDWKTLIDGHPEIMEKDSQVYRFPGSVLPSPALTGDQAIKLIFALPVRHGNPPLLAAKNAFARVIARYLGGDTTLIPEINKLADAQARLPEDHPMRAFAQQPPPSTTAGRTEAQLESDQRILRGALGLARDLAEGMRAVSDIPGFKFDPRVAEMVQSRVTENFRMAANYTPQLGLIEYLGGGGGCTSAHALAIGDLNDQSFVSVDQFSQLFFGTAQKTAAKSWIGAKVSRLYAARYPDDQPRSDPEHERKSIGKYVNGELHNVWLYHRCDEDLLRQACEEYKSKQ